jgi:hypothetical protein
MSLLLRPRGSDAMVTNPPEQPWQPFDPLQVKPLDQRGICQAPLLGSSNPDDLGIPIDLASGKKPSSVAAIRGMSFPEGWASWTEGDLLEVEFTQPLPSKFDLSLRVASAYAGNRNVPIRVVAGNKERTFIVDREPLDVLLSFEAVADAKSIRIFIPQPTAPRTVDGSPDDRKLGIALVSMRVVAR